MNDIIRNYFFLSLLSVMPFHCFLQSLNPVGRYVSVNQKKSLWVLTVSDDQNFACTVRDQKTGIEEGFFGTWTSNGDKIFLNSGEMNPYAIYKLKVRDNQVIAKPIRMFGRYRLIRKLKWKLVKSDT